MGKALRLAAVMAVLLFAATSRSDVAADTTTGALEAPPPDPTTTSSSADTHHRPFTQYGIGGAENAWPYEALSVEEQGVADRGRDPGDAWRRTHDGFANASAELGRKAASESAQRQLGIDDGLATIGVVP